MKVVFKVLGFLFWATICTVIVMSVPEVLGKKWLEMLIELSVLIPLGIGFFYLWEIRLIRYLFPKELEVLEDV